MRIVYGLYYLYVLAGVGALVAIAYAVPRRMKERYPEQFERLQNRPIGASSSYAREIMLGTGDKTLRVLLGMQHIGFYVWAAGAAAFTTALFVWG